MAAQDENNSLAERLKGPKMEQIQYAHAVTELCIALEMVENNEPINRAEGRIEQADLQAARATDLRAAIRALSGQA